MRNNTNIFIIFLLLFAIVLSIFYYIDNQFAGLSWYLAKIDYDINSLNNITYTTTQLITTTVTTTTTTTQTYTTTTTMTTTETVTTTQNYTTTLTTTVTTTVTTTETVTITETVTTSPWFPWQ